MERHLVLYSWLCVVLLWVCGSPGHAAERTGLSNEDMSLCNPLQAGTALNNTTLATAIASTSVPDCSGNKVLLLTPGTWSITNDLTIPDRLAVHVPQGALFSVSGGVTLTLDCRKLVTSTYPVFTGAGTVACSSTPFTVAFNASLTLAVDTSTVQTVTLTGNVTSITLSRPEALLARGALFWVRFIQDATGGRTVSGWPGSVLWTSGGPPVIDTRANAQTLVGLLYDGSNWRDLHIRRALAAPPFAPVWTLSGLCTSSIATIPAAGGASYVYASCTDAATDCLYATSVPLPAGWSALSGVLVQGTAIHTGTPTGEALVWDVSAQCRAAGATQNNTWGTAQTLTLSFTTVNQMVGGSTATIVPNGTCTGSTHTTPLTVNVRACQNTAGTVCATGSACKLTDLNLFFVGP